MLCLLIMADLHRRPPDASHAAIVGLYERHARQFDRDRGHTLDERPWLDRFLSYVPESGSILDVGCGTGEPLARYLIDAGRHVAGVDSSPSMIAMCRARFPESEWLVADMRELAMNRRFDGILAWDSFFHLHADDQRAMFPRFAAHAREGTALMFTSGPSAGEAIGSYCGEPLYHASLDRTEYETLLAANGFIVRHHIVSDPACGDHTVWIATSSVRNR
jgi:SAM-dependent methyltransferase